MKIRLAQRFLIKIKATKGNLLYIFDTIDFEDNPHYLLLEDLNGKLQEKYNDAHFTFVPKDTNKVITIQKGNNILTLPNIYTNRCDKPLNKALLKKYCGREEVPSNLILQIIHNNEDLRKIISLYVNDVIYALYSIIKHNKKDEPISKISSNFYFANDTIYCGDTEYIDEDAPNMKDKNTYDLYELLNTLILRKNIYGFVDTSKEMMFEYIKGISSIRNNVAHSVIDKSYDLSFIAKDLEKYIEVNGQKFVSQNQLNIYLISKLYPNNVNEELKRYYLYILNEQSKNIGISIKKIIECSKKIYPSNITNEEKIKKYNTILQYHIYNYLLKHKDLNDKYYILLNEAEKEEKDKLYEELTKKIGDKVFKEVSDVCKDINFKRNYYNPKLNNKDAIKDILNIKYNWQFLSLQIYTLSKFLTMRESNTLISLLIKKLQSIASLKKASEVVGIDLNKYFNNNELFFSFDLLDELIEQLRIIKSIRRFTSWKNQDIENAYILEGLKLFKNNYSDAKLKAFLAEKSDLKVYEKKSIKSPFRNFIRNNICKSRDFDYLIRYTDAKKVSNLLYHNPALVEFLFSRMEPFLSEKIINNGVTVESISNITLESLAENVRNGNMDYSSNVKIYLKCIFILIKNMIRINSYYFLAFSFYERDQKLIDPKYNPDKKIYNVKYNLNLVDYTHLKLKNDTTLKAVTNFEVMPKSNNPKNNIFVVYRNLVEHLEINNIISTMKFPENFKFGNYFKIYHYCLQKELIATSTYNDNEFIKMCADNIEKYGTYSKKLLYALNAIFIYNPARYKDISAEAIYMKKYE